MVSIAQMQTGRRHILRQMYSMHSRREVARLEPKGETMTDLTEQEYDAIQRLLFDAISKLRQADSAVATARDMLCDWRARP